MNIYKIILIAILAAASVFWIYGFFKTKKPIKCFVRSAVLGILSLIAVAFIGNYCEIHVGVNLPSLIVSGVLGLPGVIFMAVVNML